MDGPETGLLEWRNKSGYNAACAIQSVHWTNVFMNCMLLCVYGSENSRPRHAVGNCDQMLSDFDLNSNDIEQWFWVSIFQLFLRGENWVLILESSEILKFYALESLINLLKNIICMGGTPMGGRCIFKVLCITRKPYVVYQWKRPQNFRSILLFISQVSTSVYHRCSSHV